MTFSITLTTHSRCIPLNVVDERGLHVGQAVLLGHLQGAEPRTRHKGEVGPVVQDQLEDLLVPTPHRLQKKVILRDGHNTVEGGGLGEGAALSAENVFLCNDVDQCYNMLWVTTLCVCRGVWGGGGTTVTTCCGSQHSVCVCRGGALLQHALGHNTVCVWSGGGGGYCYNMLWVTTQCVCVWWGGGINHCYNML